MSILLILGRLKLYFCTTLGTQMSFPIKAKGNLPREVNDDAKRILVCKGKLFMQRFQLLFHL